jgi:hypothetical protein
MKKIASVVCIGIVASLFLFTSCESNPAQKNEHEHSADKKFDKVAYAGVENAIKDYVEGIYLVDSTRIEKSVDTTLRKVGYWFHPKKKEYLDNLPMSYSQLVRLAARWNKDGSRANEQSPKKIEIYDINSKTASAKLTAAWGIDYFHLSNVNGQWKIMNVIWQSMPKDKEEE